MLGGECSGNPKVGRVKPNLSSRMLSGRGEKNVREKHWRNEKIFEMVILMAVCIGQ